MGNTGSSSSGARRRHHRRRHPPLQPPQPANGSSVYAHPSRSQSQSQSQSHYPNTVLPPYHQYPGYYPRSRSPSSVVLSGPGQGQGPNSQSFRSPVAGNLLRGGQLPCGPVSPAPVAPYVEHQKAATIRIDVNIKKDTLRIEPDQENPGNFLVAFTFDATAPGCITVMFFAKETLDGKLIAVEESLLKQISMPFQQGLCQNFRQPSGTGIEFSMLQETMLTKGDIEVYPLVLKAEARPLNRYENNGNPSSQITLASFGKREKGGYKVQVMKQVLWVNGNRYELQEIYGIGNASNGDLNGHESGGECVICLSEPREITVLPCRHMCMCSGCANLLKAHTDNCPICRHPVERLLEIEVNNGSGDP